MGELLCLIKVIALTSGISKGNMISLIDSFNNVVISRHRNVKNALKAKGRHSKVIKKEAEKTISSFWVPLAYSIKDSSGKEICSFNS
jgi:hypothetical protein